jgi:hypothetical protein
MKDVADVSGFPDRSSISCVSCASSRQFYVFASMFLPFLFQMAIFMQLLRRRMTKRSNMLPPVAAVLPVEKLNETLVK